MVNGMRRLLKSVAREEGSVEGETFCPFRVNWPFSVKTKNQIFLAGVAKLSSLLQFANF